jgi:hypothetical protein
VAPLAVPLVILPLILVIGEDLPGAYHEYGLRDPIEMFRVVGRFLIQGAAIAYAIAVVVGLPLGKQHAVT